MVEITNIESDEQRSRNVFSDQLSDSYTSQETFDFAAMKSYFGAPFQKKCSTGF